MGFLKCHWTWDLVGASPAEPFPTLQPQGEPLAGIWAMGIGSQQHRHKRFELPRVRSESPLNCQLPLVDTSVLV